MRRFATLFVAAVVAIALIGVSSSTSVAAAHPIVNTYTPTSNGCGPEGGPAVPNYFYFYNLFGHLDVFPFVNGCDNHDICYGTLGSNKDTCDSNFYNDLWSICDQNASTSISRYYCDAAAWTYYQGVHLFGGSAFKAAQDQARRG